MPADINRSLNGIPNSELADAISAGNGNNVLANLLKSGNTFSEQLVTLMSNMGYTVTRGGLTTHHRADGSPLDTFKP